MDATVWIWLVVIGSSIWVACDAHVQRIATDQRPYSWRNGAAVWFCCCVMLWIVAFPYYLARRAAILRRLSLKNEKQDQ